MCFFFGCRGPVLYRFFWRNFWRNPSCVGRRDHGLSERSRRLRALDFFAGRRATLLLLWLLRCCLESDLKRDFERVSCHKRVIFGFEDFDLESDGVGGSNLTSLCEVHVQIVASESIMDNADEWLVCVSIDDHYEGLVWSCGKDDLA